MGDNFWWRPRNFLPRNGQYGQQWRMRSFYPNLATGALGIGSYMATKFLKRDNNKTNETVNSQFTGNRMNMPVRGKFIQIRKKKRIQKKGKKIGKKYKKYIKKVVESGTSNLSTNSWRDVSSGQLSCEANECSYGYVALLTRTQIESAIDGAKVIDPNAGTLASATVDLTSIDGIATKIINAKAILTWRNNAQTPINLKCYWMSMKKRTAVSPTAQFENGLEQRGITTNELTDLRFDVYDSPEMKDYYKIYKIRKFKLNGGDELEISMEKKTPFDYDPDEFDEHVASEYNPKQTQIILFRLEGVPSHDDTTTGNVGTCNGTLDYIVKTHIKFSSSLGLGAKYKQLITGTGTLDAQAADPAVVVAPVEQVKETL